MLLNFYDAAGPAGLAGIFIPRSSLPGILTNNEFAAAEPYNMKASKFAASFLFAIQNFLVTARAATTNPLRLYTGLGIDVTKSAPAGTGPNRFSQTFTCLYSQAIDNRDQEIVVIPVPTAGDNQNRGQLPIAQVFQGAVNLDASDDTPGAGVLIHHATAAQFGAGINTLVANDGMSRKWIMAMFRMLFEDVPIRNAAQSIQSGVTAKAQTPVANATLPPNATVAPNPTTNLQAAELVYFDIYSRSVTFTIEYEINEVTQTYDVRVA